MNKDTKNLQNKLFYPNHAYSGLGFGDVFNVLLSCIGRGMGGMGWDLLWVWCRHRFKVCSHIETIIQIMPTLVLDLESSSMCCHLALVEEY